MKDNNLLILSSNILEDSDSIDLSYKSHIVNDSLNNDIFWLQNFDYSKNNMQTTFAETKEKDIEKNYNICRVIQDIFCVEKKEEIELNEDDENNSSIFINKLKNADSYENKNKNKKRPGRKIKDEGKHKRKIHDRYDEDNILTKIQVHYMNFVVNIANDAIKTIFKNKNKLCFKYIDYEIKKNIKKEDFENLKNKPIKEILKKPISNKYRSLSKIIDYNKEIYDALIKLDKSDWLKNFFETKYIDLFKKYYNNTEKLNKYNFKDKDIIFSNKTKSFYDLIQNNEKLKNSIIKVTEEAYQVNYFQINKIAKI